MPAQWSYDLLSQLTRTGALELGSEGDVASLATELGQAMELDANPWVNAVTVSEWLVNHDAVLELYVDDMEIAGILEKQLA